jgi:hypothetical protein
MDVETILVVTAGTTNPLIVMAFEKSRSETSGVTSIKIFLLLRTVGVKWRPTPKDLYSIVIDVPPAPGCGLELKLSTGKEVAVFRLV